MSAIITFTIDILYFLQALANTRASMYLLTHDSTLTHQPAR